MTALQKKPISPIAHLSDEDIENLGHELDAIRDQVLASRGERDAAYIRTVITTLRSLEATSAPKIQELFDRYGLTNTAGPIHRQVASAWHKVIRLSLPNLQRSGQPDRSGTVAAAA